MSQFTLFVKSGFVTPNLTNGIGRYVPQCQRMTIKFCLNHGGSLGVRDFIQFELVDFARANPGTAVYLKPRRHRSPVLVAEYLNGSREWWPLHNMQRGEVAKWIDTFITAAGNQNKHLKSYQQTETPSIQGPWTPFTHRPLERNILKYPQESLNTPLKAKPSTTEIINKMFGEEAKLRN